MKISTSEKEEKNGELFQINLILNLKEKYPNLIKVLYKKIIIINYNINY